MFSIQQIANVWVHFFYESLQNILSQEVSLVQLSQKLEQLVNQTGGEVLKAILKQADEAIYDAVDTVRCDGAYGEKRNILYNGDDINEIIQQGFFQERKFCYCAI